MEIQNTMNEIMQALGQTDFKNILTIVKNMLSQIKSETNSDGRAIALVSGLMKVRQNLS